MKTIERTLKFKITTTINGLGETKYTAHREVKFFGFTFWRILRYTDVFNTNWEDDDCRHVQCTSREGLNEYIQKYCDRIIKTEALRLKYKLRNQYRIALQETHDVTVKVDVG